MSDEAAPREVAEWLAPGGGRLALGIAHVAALVLFVDQRLTPKLGTLDPWWTLGLYFAVPLGGALLIDANSWRGRALGLVAMGLGLGPAVWRVASGAPKDEFVSHPERLVPYAVAGALVAVVGAALDLDRARWGLSLGDWRWWGPRVGAACLAIVPFVGASAWVFPSLLEFYPSEIARGSTRAFVSAQLGRGVYFVGWEFFYRGFLLFGLGRVFGPLGASITQAFPFFLLHRGKPQIEMASSFPGGVLLAALCWRAGSFWPAFLLHWAMNLTMECVGLLG